MTFLEMNALRKNYGPVAALDGVDLSVPLGSRTAIIGPSGSGKTTLLRLIAGFDRPDSGRIVLDGTVLVDGSDMVPPHRREIGVVAQEGALFPHLTIAENIGFGLAGNAAAQSARVRELLDMVGLEQAMLARKPDELSGGQQQRVGLARALARKPRLMLLDEPFSALDTGLRASTRKAVAQVLAEAGVTTILVTHDQAEALAFADQVAVMRNGRLVQVGPPRDLYLQPNDAMTAVFLGEAIILPATVANGVAVCGLGQLQVDVADWQGPAQLMLRPEQLSIAPAAAAAGQGGGADAILGTITDIDFCGASYDVAIRVSADCAFRLRMSSLEVMAPGDVVKITVLGSGHLLKG